MRPKQILPNPQGVQFFLFTCAGRRYANIINFSNFQKKGRVNSLWLSGE